MSLSDRAKVAVYSRERDVDPVGACVGMVLRSVKDRLKKFNVAVSETAYQDLWQRAELGIVTISTSNDVVDQALAAARDEIDRVEPGLITRTQVDMMEA